MDLSSATTDSSARKARTRRWRSLLAGLISFALALSYFHGDGFAMDDADLVAVVAMSVGDASDKAPAHPASPHGDHCLTHVSPVAMQETAIAVEYAPHAYRFVSMREPDSAERLSPFKPPRA